MAKYKIGGIVIAKIYVISGTAVSCVDNIGDNINTVNAIVMKCICFACFIIFSMLSTICTHALKKSLHILLYFLQFIKVICFILSNTTLVSYQYIEEIKPILNW